ncbi:hypothetical protein IPM62_02000 [Candidatus Woesebacteria bacterium]|nr:MAG: hypothetical protein IPM62_02000 [Candidatus Woesebacteria bacterium]
MKRFAIFIILLTVFLAATILIYSYIVFSSNKKNCQFSFSLTDLPNKQVICGLQTIGHDDSLTYIVKIVDVFEQDERVYVKANFGDDLRLFSLGKIDRDESYIWYGSYGKLYEAKVDSNPVVSVLNSSLVEKLKSDKNKYAEIVFWGANDTNKVISEINESLLDNGISEKNRESLSERKSYFENCNNFYNNYLTEASNRSFFYYLKQKVGESSKKYTCTPLITGMLIYE